MNQEHRIKTSKSPLVSINLGQTSLSWLLGAAAIKKGKARFKGQLLFSLVSLFLLFGGMICQTLESFSFVFCGSGSDIGDFLLCCSFCFWLLYNFSYSTFASTFAPGVRTRNPTKGSKRFFIRSFANSSFSILGKLIEWIQLNHAGLTRWGAANFLLYPKVDAKARSIISVRSNRIFIISSNLLLFVRFLN